MGDTVSEAKVVEATGHGRDHWFAIIEAYGDCSHTQGTTQLSKDHPNVPGWWVQTLVVDYERDAGIREVGQSCAGDYQVGCSKTVALDAEEAYERIVTSPFLSGANWQEGAEWDTEGATVQVRRADAGKMLRWFWFDEDGKSTVEIYFHPKEDKTTVTIRHHQLASKQARERYRAKWKGALQQIFMAGH